jgi:N-dimethylarginine dimethylaminohydrolase
LKNKLKISTNNEYGALKSVLLGTAENMAWPDNDREFNDGIARSTYAGTLSKGALPSLVIDQATEDLDKFADTMERKGINVVRPQTVGPHWAYSARDVLLTIGDKVIECPTPFSSRAFELELYPALQEADGKIIRAPKPQDSNDPMFDAANVLKLDDKLLYSMSHSANEAGAEWLQEQVGTAYEVVKWKVLNYQITHIDSTLLSCAPNTILINATRVDDDQLPTFMHDYRKIWIEDIVTTQFVDFPYSSKWIGMNVLSLDPETIVVDETQVNLIERLKSEKFDVIALPMRQSRTLGGGFHCVTCDIERL